MNQSIKDLNKLEFHLRPVIKADLQIFFEMTHKLSVLVPVVFVGAGDGTVNTP